MRVVNDLCAGWGEFRSAEQEMRLKRTLMKGLTLLRFANFFAPMRFVTFRG